MNIAIIGTGHVGLVTGACFAHLGNNVICADIDEDKINKLKNGTMPIYEPGLDQIVERNMGEKRLSFTTSIKEAVVKSDIIFICVGTPPKRDGDADLSYVENVAREIAECMESYKVIVEKSTVPVETGERVEEVVKRNNRQMVEFDVVSNPEFLREGSAVNDFLHPDRIVIGVKTKRAEDVMKNLYAPFNAQILVTDIKSAEIIKHASNSFLATKISFINALANVCERVGADIGMVAEGIGLDKRIGKAFLNAGIGYGGSCFPKDVEAFIKIAEKNNYDFRFLKEVQNINEQQKKLFIKKIEKKLWNVKGKTIAVLGLAFKPNTDDMRLAPSIDIINILQAEGARIKAYDPAAMEKAKTIFKDVQYCNDPYDALNGSDAMVVVTEWDEFRKIDMERVKTLLKHPIIIDGRNVYDPEEMMKLGFDYVSVGR